MEYRGYDVEIKQDVFAPNPFDGGDETPIMVYHERSPTYYGLDPEITFTDQHYRQRSSAICEILGISSLFCLRSGYGYDVVDNLNYGMNLLLDDLTVEEQMEAKCRLYNEVLGWEALCKVIRGYNQGDWGMVLAVNTPECIETFGSKTNLQQAIDLYRYWAYGNCYYFQLEDEFYGTFYTDDNEYLEYEIRLAVDELITWKRKKWFERLKTLIKNNVPLNVRAAEMRKRTA